MEKKLSVYLLGVDQELLGKITKRTNETRPAEIQLFSELKVFLATCMNNPPDVVAVSVNVNHPNISKFPKIFQMALGLPVIVFGENHDSSTRKLVRMTSAEFKISGLITAQSFWIKLQKIKSNMEDEESGKGSINSKIKKPQNSTMVLKGKNSKKHNVKSGSPNLLSILMNPDQAEFDDSFQGMVEGENSKLKTNGQPGMLSASDPKVPNESKKHQSEEESSNFKKDKRQNEQDRTSKKKQNSSDHKTQQAQDLAKNNPVDATSDLESGDEGFKNFNKNPSPTSANNPGQKEKGFQGPSKSGASAEAKESTSKEKNFGGIKLKDEKEVKKKNQELKKKTQEKDFEKKKNLLQESCELTIKKYFETKSLTDPRQFDVLSVYAYTIEMADFRGFLLLANSFNSEFEESLLSGIEDSISENFKKHGFNLQMSRGYSIHISGNNYEETVDAICQFSIKEEEENGRQIFMSFLPIEKVHPTYTESEKEGMLNVDLQAVPPDTPVNFDAFIYLPRNQRFVRYLKKGRSLSLKQIKKLIESGDSNHIYLPKTEKGKFIQFFIENTVQWEFMTYTPKEEAA